jgi:hypothetical protein
VLRPVAGSGLLTGVGLALRLPLARMTVVGPDGAARLPGPGARRYLSLSLARARRAWSSRSALATGSAWAAGSSRSTLATGASRSRGSVGGAWSTRTAWANWSGRTASRVALRGVQRVRARPAQRVAGDMAAERIPLRRPQWVRAARPAQRIGPPGSGRHSGGRTGSMPALRDGLAAVAIARQARVLLSLGPD